VKKKILSGVFALALLATAGFGVQKSMKSDAGLSDLALSNVEALADNEIGNGRWIVTVYSPSHWKCDPNGGASCPGTPW
jgi:hypothetical protein